MTHAHNMVHGHELMHAAPAQPGCAHATRRAPVPGRRPDARARAYGTRYEITPARLRQVGHCTVPNTQHASAAGEASACAVYEGEPEKARGIDAVSGEVGNCRKLLLVPLRLVPR